MEGRREGKKKGWMSVGGCKMGHSWKGGRKEGREEGRKEGRKEGVWVDARWGIVGRKAGGWKEGRKDGWIGGWDDDRWIG